MFQNINEILLRILEYFAGICISRPYSAGMLRHYRERCFSPKTVFFQTGTNLIIFVVKKVTQFFNYG